MVYKVLSTTRSFGRVSTKPVEWLKRQGFEVVTTDLPKPLAERDIINLIKDMDAAIVGNDRITTRIFEAANHLKVISMHGVGVDNIDLKSAEEHGVVVTNTPGANTEAVAELTIGLIFSLVRQIPQAHISTRAGGWQRFVGTEIKGKTAGIIGFGNIGKSVAGRLKALGMKVVTYDIVKDKTLAVKGGVRYAALEDLLRDSDIVTIHIPFTAETRNLLNRQRLKLLKKGAFLINTARGGLVDEDAMAEMLKDGRLAGAALDVYDREPPEMNPLLKIENCITLPHIGAYTIDAIERMGMMAAENVVSVIKGKKSHNIVRAK